MTVRDSTDLGSITIATATAPVQHLRLTLSTTERLTIAGTGRLGLAELTTTGAVAAAIATAKAYADGLVDNLSGVTDRTTALANLGIDTSGAYQPVDADLTAIAALATTSFGRALLTLADTAALQSAVGVTIGTDVEAHDADLTTIAGLTPSNDDILQRKSGAWTNRTVAQYLSDLGLGALYQPLDSDLTAIAALTTTPTGRSLLAAADAAALRTILALGTAATHATGDYDASGAASTAQTAAQSYADALVDDLSGVTNASTARTNLGLGTAATHATGDYDAAGAAAAAQTASQPLDSDLTAIAALSTTSFGRALLVLADAAALRTAAALGGAATLNVGTSAGTVAAGDDSRLTDARAPLAQRLDPGTFTMADEQFVIQYGHLKLAGSERYTMAGTARLILTDLHAQDSVIAGTPKQPTQSFTVPTDWSLDQMFRLSLTNNMRATLQGNADLILTDDFKSRSRLVLS